MCRASHKLHAVVTFEDVIRFAAKVASHATDPDACWPWQGFIDPAGYGKFKFNGKAVFAHRFAFAILNGELIAGHQVHHRCFNRRCCNPRHLEQTTHSENASMKSPRGREAA